MNILSKSSIKIIIPARIGSSRLYGKPLVDIGEKPMIIHVLERAKQANIGEIAVATDCPSIVECVEKYGGRAILTAKTHESGSDRVWEAACLMGVKDEDIIINLQGDLPNICPSLIRASLKPLENKKVDFATLVAKITDGQEIENENVVKMAGFGVGENIMRAVYFSRAAIPYGSKGGDIFYHHIGLYAWRAKALARFVKLPPSELELREKLEQLRAIQAGMVCYACIVDKIPIGIDTPADLEKVKKLL